jgi:hypothetical protein
MSSRTFDFSNDELESQLAALGSRIEWAPTPDLASGVLAEVAVPTPLRRSSHRRRWLAAAAMALLLIGALLAASSSIRGSVAGFLGIDGLRIELGEPETTPTSMPNLGTPTSAQELARWLPFTPMQPSALGEPDAVYLRILDNGDTLGIMAWEASESLPRTAETDLGALLMQFAPPEDTGMMLKTVGLSTGTVTDTFVDGSRAYWVEGASELTIYGAGSTETRPSGNVLIWQTDGIGYRLESALSMDEAIVIAESLERAASPS